MKIHRGEKGCSGFTLFELLVIIMILGIVAAHALPTFQEGLAASKRSAGAAEVVMALGYAQMHAVTKGVQTKVTFDVNADTILVEQYKMTGSIASGATEIPQDEIETLSLAAMAHPTKRGEGYFIVFADEERLKDVDVISALFGVHNYVTFNAQGMPSAGGTVILSYGSRQATVTLNALSGNVTTGE